MEIKIEDKAFIFHVEEHAEIKDQLLKLIEGMGTFSFTNEHQQISHTDWHLAPDWPRPYGDLILPILQNYWPYENLDCTNYWFQQYKIGDYHGPHRHGSTNYSSVYFLELPDEKLVTKYVGIPEFEIAEGDYLLMPGHIEHESPLNTTGRKTSIILNLNFP